jgi:catechol 2,3-dioxygenase-like lactoylglutathione lyase family enzyme
MVQTCGLTHINLAVRDLGRALRFYEQVEQVAWVGVSP